MIQNFYGCEFALISLHESDIWYSHSLILDSNIFQARLKL